MNEDEEPAREFPIGSIVQLNDTPPDEPIVNRPIGFQLDKQKEDNADKKKKGRKRRSR